MTADYGDRFLLREKSIANTENRQSRPMGLSLLQISVKMPRPTDSHSTEDDTVSDDLIRWKGMPVTKDQRLVGAGTAVPC